MAKEYFAVCGYDEVYVRKMYEFFLGHYGKDFEVVLFTDREAFGEFVKEKEVSVLLTEEGFMTEDNNNVYHKVTLTEDEKRSKQEGNVFKYMACDKIFKEVMAVCAAGDRVGEINENPEEKMVIGVYSPIKRCFQTTFALTTGQILAKNKKVLYLNFESFSGFDSMMSSTSKTDLMDLVYFSECDSSNFSYRVEAMKEKIGELDYISPVKAYVKYAEVSRKQWELLIDNLLSKTEYEVIILDLSEQVNGLLDILKKCKRIYTITDDDKVASAKVAQYQNLLRESAYEEILEKTENIKLPRFREIPYNFEMLPHSEMADFVKKMLEFDQNEETDGNGC